MSRTTKRNVEQFNADVLQHGGYRYAEHPTYSAIVSNKRINDEAERIIRRLGNVRSIIDVGCGDGHTRENSRRASPKSPLPALTLLRKLFDARQNAYLTASLWSAIS